MTRITQARLHTVLHYDAATGVFSWKATTSNRVSAGRIAGSPAKDGYTKIQVDGTMYQSHRLAWFYVHGVWPKAYIDHIDANPSNNAIANLREATQRQNLGNARLRKDNKSGFKGVRFDQGKWLAHINDETRQRYLGSFLTPDAAAAAYAAAAREVFGEFARTE